MSDRRRTWVRTQLVRLGRALMAGLAAMGSCWGAGAYLATTKRSDSQSLDDHGDVEAHDEAVRGIAEIEVYLATVDQPTRRPDQPRRRRGHGEAR